MDERTKGLIFKTAALFGKAVVIAIQLSAKKK
jgi:hypothetical protein